MTDDLYTRAGIAAQASAVDAVLACFALACFTLAGWLAWGILTKGV